MLSVEINGTDRTAYVQAKSIRITDAVNERSVGSIGLLDVSGAYRPAVGEVVDIYEDTSLIFSGSIDDLSEEKIKGSAAVKYNSVPLVDYHQAADRRIVAEAYESQTAGYIANALITNYLAAEGITAGTIQTGPTISKAVFNYIKCSQCFDELSEITGFQWRINPDKTLDFFDRATFTGTAVTDTSQIENVRVKKSRDTYRNRQYLRAGQDVTSVQTRTFKGDGETQVFTVDLPIATEPSIEVDSVAKTIGIRGLDTGRDWYWQKGEREVSQDDAGTKLTSSNILSVDFQGYIPVIIVAENPDEIESRKNVEGGTGLYESTEEKSSLDTRASALEYADGLLRRYANIGTSLSFETYVQYRAGQLVSVNLTDHDINETMLAASVTITDEAATDGRLKYAVKLVSGESFGGWVNFFKKLADKNATYSIRENEVLVKLISLRDNFMVPEIEDEMTYVLHQYNICGQTICGTGVIL